MMGDGVPSRVTSLTDLEKPGPLPSPKSARLLPRLLCELADLVHEAHSHLDLLVLVRDGSIY